MLETETCQATMRQRPSRDQTQGRLLPDQIYLYTDVRSRFGRWRSWIEKRAGERYADITPAETERRVARGWGEGVRLLHQSPVSDLTVLVDSSGARNERSFDFADRSIRASSQLSTNTTTVFTTPLHRRTGSPYSLEG